MSLGETVPEVREEHVHRHQLDAWQEHTTEPLRRRTFPGGHFYLYEQPADVLSLVHRS